VVVVGEDTNVAAYPVEVADDPGPHIVRGARATLTCLRLLMGGCLCDGVSDGGAHQSRLPGGWPPSAQW
jgi:hypothetical protein